MNTSNLSLVPLRQASLCLDCETITAAQSRCRACGSRALLNVARVLDQFGYRSTPRPDNAAIRAVPPTQTPRPGDFAHST